MDAVEPQIRALLREYPTMPATVIAERIGWTRSITVLKDRVRAVRPEYRGVDPVDKLAHEPGDTMQCDLWFPEPRIPVGGGQAAMLPVLVMTLAYSRFISARMIPSRSGADLLAGMWALIQGLGAVTKRLWWDRESAIGGSGTLSAGAAAFAGTLATKIVLAPPRDPEFKGMVERHNGYLETSFLPGRSFTSPVDFNTQLADWLPRANQRLVRSLAPVTGTGAGGRPAEHLATDLAAMTGLPPVAPTVGWRHRVRLGREYYIRLDTCDYSVDPSVIGRFVDVHADLERVRVTCEGRLVADHCRSWARRGVVTDPAHVTTATNLRAAGKHQQAARAAVRRHGDGHHVALRALPDYDALFGVEFSTPTSPTLTGQAR
jgi:transposase